MGAEARAEFSVGTDLGHSKKEQKVMPDGPSRMNTSRGDDRLQNAVISPGVSPPAAFRSRWVGE
jgi:hypothetical protein